MLKAKCFVLKTLTSQKTFENQHPAMQKRKESNLQILSNQRRFESYLRGDIK